MKEGTPKTAADWKKWFEDTIKHYEPNNEFDYLPMGYAGRKLFDDAFNEDVQRMIDEQKIKLKDKP